MVALNFDSSQVEPSAPIEPLPAGEYKVQIVQSEMKETKNGSGQMLVLEMDVIDNGEFANRKIWDRLNIINANKTAQEIAQRTLSSICHAVGIIGQLTDSEQLHFKPMTIKVAVREHNDNLYNDVKSYRAASGQAPTPAGAPVQPTQPAAPAPATTPQPAAAASSVPPWRRTS